MQKFIEYDIMGGMPFQKGNKLRLGKKILSSHGFQKGHKINVGRKLTPNHIQKLREKVFTEEYRKHLKETHVGMKGKHHTKKSKSLIGKANSGKNNYWYGKHLSEETLKKMRGCVVSEDTKEKIRAKRLIQKIPSKDTKIELIMREELKKHNIDFQEQVPLGGVAIVDFFIPKSKITIQCDGEYWHQLPKRKISDARQDEVLRNQGYKVFRFWGNDIKKSVSSCVNSLQL